MRRSIYKGIVITVFFSIILFPLNLAAKSKIDIFLFYSPHCKACLGLKHKFLPKIMSEYEKKVNLKLLDVTHPSNLALLISISKQFYGKKSVVPSLLIGNDFLRGKREIENNLEKLIEKYSQRKFSLPSLLPSQSLMEIFKGLTTLTVMGAGLIDGINPCAFAVIIFFISFLTVYGYQKQEIVYIGIFYVLAVFITYLLMGMGIFKFLYSLKHFYFLMKLFYYSVAGFCFLLSLFSLYDYFQFRKTKKSEGLILQLPRFLKRKINLVIGKGLRQRQFPRKVELCGISFLVGTCVSILEAACTGQVYIPTIAFVLKVPQLRLKAFIHLILYNIMFILPLIFIFILSLIGVNSQRLNQFLKNNLGKMKVTIAGFFFFLGILMVWLSE